MKKITLLLILSLCLLLFGCHQAPVPQPQEPAPAAPAPAPPQKAEGLAITVNGKALSGLYGEEGKYVILAEAADAIGGQWTAEGESATLTVGEQAVTFSDAEGICVGEDWYVRPAFLEQLGYHPFYDEPYQQYYYTAYPKNEELPEGVAVPTVMYHAVGDNCWGIASLFVSPSSLEKQLKYLTENGYTPIWFEDLGRADQIEKPILLTFDDGYDDNYHELLPILKKYQVKATVFVIVDLLGTEHYMTEEQVREMANSGLVSIQSHTMTHAYLNECDEEQLEYEIAQSKLAVTRLTGKESFVLCYPSGKHNDASIAKTAAHYEFGVWIRGGIYHTGDDPYMVNRKYVSRSTTLSAFKGLIA